ncbi:hypothetical protein FE840_014615 [Peteryoungia desertarenae]|uniref:Lipoprotein n=1 Tax=Peteryoungia desertarenae TaxID=1813451 RepID=A0ABX6QQY5_9HYPH|nr:hypothetical protein [Peteryoungia desertarenae]QLF70672.1 hypothetical protein FE840_014615 [Peteryoungia desertarenae]
MHQRVGLLLVLFSTAALAACGPTSNRPSTQGQSALDVMERVAVAANSCWFKSGDAAFQSYQLSPELSSFSGRPRILLVRKGSRDDRPVLVVQAEGTPPRLDAFGPLLNEDIAPRIREDVVRWANGNKGC